MAVNQDNKNPEQKEHPGKRLVDMISSETNNPVRKNSTSKGTSEQVKRLELILSGIGAGIWVWDIATGEEDWSDKLFEILGYDRTQIEPRFENFQSLLHPDHKPFILESIDAHLKENVAYKHEILMKHGSGDYRWYETSGQAVWNEEGEAVQMAGSLTDINNRKKLEELLQNSEFLLTEAGRIAHLGAWEIDLRTMTPIWSEEVYRIHEVPFSYKPNMEEAINFYHPDYRQLITDSVNRGIEEGKGWDVECKLVTGKGNEIWVRAKGVALLDNSGKCIALRGVFQNIDDIKNKELELKETLEMARKQNDRLLDFAHIVSHNLRSHSGNLTNVFRALERSTDENDKKALLSYMNEAAKRLGETINHLSEVVKIQSEVGPVKERVWVSEVYRDVAGELKSRIKKSKAQITTSFEVQDFMFVPSYFHSILQNLLSNAIKYRDPERPLEVELRTFANPENGRTVMTCKDNGLGIDLKKQGHKIFGMYKTFHRNPEARGIGLFMVKNQIEAFGGSIKVESQKGRGSTFTVCF